MNHLQEGGERECRCGANKLIIVLKDIYISMYICNRRGCNEGCVDFLFFEGVFWWDFLDFFGGFDFILDLLCSSAFSSTNAALLNTMVVSFWALTCGSLLVPWLERDIW